MKTNHHNLQSSLIIIILSVTLIFLYIGRAEYINVLMDNRYGLEQGDYLKLGNLSIGYITDFGLERPKSNSKTYVKARVKLYEGQLEKLHSRMKYVVVKESIFGSGRSIVIEQTTNSMSGAKLKNGEKVYALPWSRARALELKKEGKIIWLTSEPVRQSFQDKIIRGVDKLLELLNDLQSDSTEVSIPNSQ